jgi:hypothetical protein
MNLLEKHAPPVLRRPVEPAGTSGKHMLALSFSAFGPLSDIDLCAQQSSAGSLRRFQTPRLSRYGAPLELKDHTHGGS